MKYDCLRQPEYPNSVADIWSVASWPGTLKKTTQLHQLKSPDLVILMLWKLMLSTMPSVLPFSVWSLYFLGCSGPVHSWTLALIPYA